MKLAIVHDYLNQMGGAERVLLTLHEIFPQAPIYTSIYAPDLVDPAFRKMDVRTTFMQRLPLVHHHHQAFLPIFPFAFESIDLREYDVVLSMSSGWAKNVLTRPETCHLCYCLTPMRFAWSSRDYAKGERISPWQMGVIDPILFGLRLWDAVGSNRVDAFAAISATVKQRIKKYYRREAAIIHPPVDTHRFGARTNGGAFYLTVARLIPYRRIDLVVEAFRQLDLPVVIVGDGRDRARLQARATKNIEFVGRVDDNTLRDLYASCRAYLFPAEEDFGIAPVEAQAAGRPVVAYAAGGSLDTVIDGETGVFFREQTPEALAQAVRRLESMSFDADRIRANAARFSSEVFHDRFTRYVAEACAEWQALGPARPAALV
jgi:glycosyltransferase involved in cell wall biosynthesis